MLLAEAKRLVRDYGAWLNEGFDIELEGDYAVISTPFLDPHNDEIELYVRKEGDSLVLTDRGSTLSDLESSGLDRCGFPFYLPSWWRFSISFPVSMRCSISRHGFLKWRG